MLLNSSLHHPEIVAAYLIPEPSTTSMYENEYLTFFLDPKPFCNLHIKDLVHFLDLEEVIAASQAAKLWTTSLLRYPRYFVWVSCLHAAVLFTMFLIFGPTIPVVYCPFDAFAGNLF